MLFGIEAVVWVPLLGTIIATVGVKVVERWLSRRDRGMSDAAMIRSELKEQVTGYKEEIRRLEDEVDELRSKYYATLEELVAKRIELQDALATIKKLSEQVQETANQAQQIIADTP